MERVVCLAEYTIDELTRKSFIANIITEFFKIMQQI